MDFPHCLDVAAPWVSTSHCKKALGAQFLAGWGLGCQLCEWLTTLLLGFGSPDACC